MIVSSGVGRRELGDATYRILEVGNEVVAVLVLLEASERHLRAGNVLCIAGQVSLDAGGSKRLHTPSWGSRGTRRGCSRPK